MYVLKPEFTAKEKKTEVWFETLQMFMEWSLTLQNNWNLSHQYFYPLSIKN